MQCKYQNRKGNILHWPPFAEIIYIFASILEFWKPLRHVVHRPHAPDVEFTVFVPDILERFL